MSHSISLNGVSNHPSCNLSLSHNDDSGAVMFEVLDFRIRMRARHDVIDGFADRARLMICPASKTLGIALISRVARRHWPTPELLLRPHCRESR